MIVLRILLITMVLAPAPSMASAATLPPGFTETQIGGLAGGTAMAIAPDGRIFVCLQGGSLRVIKNGALLPTPFLTLTVDSTGERGLLGVAFDPDYANNRFIYVYYTATTPGIHNRVSRFTADIANEDVAIAGSEVALLNLENLSATNHNGGAIHFGPDGKLYIATGENAVPSFSQSLVNRLGKILRINSDGTIPEDNPTSFPNIAGSPAGVNRAIWAVGLRNPFTFAFQPGTTRMFINDVGANAWEEINDGIAGSNYGWPSCEGNCSPPNANFRDPLLRYGHGISPTTGCAIAGGAFYNPSTVQFPASYVGKYFYAELCSGWIRLMDPATNTATGFATSISNPVDLQVAADGSLYYLARGSGSVFRVQFVGSGGTGPSITTHPSNQTVAQGASATFTVVASGSATLTYQWQRDQVNISGATSASYTLSSASFADNAAKFRCVVTNGFGSATSNEATLTVNAPPSISGHPANQTVTEGQPATFSVSATSSAPLTYQWQRIMTNIPGAASSSYTIASTTMSDNGAKFRCVVSNTFLDATSNEATLTVQPLPPVLLTGQGSDSAIALASPTWFRDPFPLTNPFNLSSDTKTRVAFFGINLDLLTGEDQTAVTARAEDAAMNVYLLTVEFVEELPHFDGLTQVIVVLPNNLPAGQSVLVSVTLRGQTSNKARIRIQ